MYTKFFYLATKSSCTYCVIQFKEKAFLATWYTHTRTKIDNIYTWWPKKSQLTYQLLELKPANDITFLVSTTCQTRTIILSLCIDILRMTNL